jgi:excinuclease UvrABC nuclease subunit
MINKIPINFIEDPHQILPLRYLLDNKSAIYVLYDSHRRPVYVGMGQNVLNRIKQHLKDRLAGKWTAISIFEADKKHIKDLETLALNLLNPPRNKVKGRLPPEHRYNDFLEDILRNEKANMGKLIRLIRASNK